MTTFIAQSRGGRLHLGEFNAARLRDFLKKNDGIRLTIEPQTPESSKQRKFFEGAVIPMIAFYQEGMDHRSPEDCAKVREWLKIEFNAEMAVVNGKVHKIPGSTKGKLQKGLLEKVTDWMTDQGYKTELLSPKEYKKWRDEIFPYGGPSDYISYLLELGKLS